jgi:hypothetical protein
MFTFAAQICLLLGSKCACSHLGLILQICDFSTFQDNLQFILLREKLHLHGVLKIPEMTSLSNFFSLKQEKSHLRCFKGVISGIFNSQEDHEDKFLLVQYNKELDKII